VPHVEGAENIFQNNDNDVLLIHVYDPHLMVFNAIFQLDDVQSGKTSNGSIEAVAAILGMRAQKCWRVVHSDDI
jgi:hypothetical protein